MLSTPQMAAELGITRQRLNQLGAAGKVPFVGTGSGRRWDPAAVRDAIANNLDRRQPGATPIAGERHEARTEPPARNQGPTAPPPGTLAHATLTLETAKARKAALIAEELAGRLVGVEDVRRTWERHIDAAKNRLLLLESKVPPECQALVSKEIRSALEELSDEHEA